MQSKPATIFLFAGIAAMILFAKGTIAAPIYTNDFEGPIGAEWSTTDVDTTPIGARRYLGQFRSETAALSLSGLPTHEALKIEFDLFIIATWDGNALLSVGSLQGPDIWELKADGISLVRTTFSNIENFDGVSFPQEFGGDLAFDAAGRTSAPGTRPGDVFLVSGPPGSPGNHAPRTGASEVNSLGYDAGTGHDPMDSVYHLSFMFAHTATTVQFDFLALLEGGPGETWGLDNVTVSATGVPEPASIAVLAVGLLGLGAARRRKKQAA